ncbi:MAG: D-glycerate dehydrogenase [Gammaproteobacteria bacterium]|nr:D-glycerate dehydrogenase [Gammaproteobacteria bacterium]
MADRPVVLVTRKLPPNVEARLERDYRPRLNAEDRLYDTDELLRLADGADAILPCHTESLRAEVIEKLPASVKIIATFSVGHDHIDLDAAKRRGIVVTNTPDVLADATAEITMLLLLGAARRASEGERLVRSGGWNTWSPSFMLGLQVTGKRLGIVGMGRVGQVTARRARGFDMEVHYHNRSALPPEKAQGAVYHESLEEMLPVCDFLALHCPSTPETEGLLDAERIALLPDGAVVVNAARGTVVDEKALLDALASGKLYAAGLDVYRNEPDIDPEFSRRDNMFLLPHLGSATHETRDAMGYRALDNLDAYFAGRAPGDRLA